MSKAREQKNQGQNLNFFTTSQASLIDCRWIYRGKIVNLRLDTYKLGPNTKIAEIVDHPGAVVIVPVDEQGRILLIQQWRKAAEKIMIELPAGTLEKDELPEVCAKRELQEETGYAAKTLTSLGGFYSAPGFCTEYLHLYIAEDLELKPLPPDEDEQIDLLPTPLSEAIRMVEENQIFDAKTIAGLLRYQLWKARCEK